MIRLAPTEVSCFLPTRLASRATCAPRCTSAAIGGEDLRAYHMWLLVDHGEGTHIVMEEIDLGGGAKRLAQTNPGQMHRGHDLWNISLKFLCET